MNEFLQLPAILDNIRLRKDKSVSIVFATQELTAQQILLLLQYRDKFGWMLFREDEREFEEKDIPKEKSGYEEGKTPARRLRGIIFQYWSQEKKETEPDFESYYRKVVEKQIEFFKEKLV